jgi:hypothetical protein
MSSSPDNFERLLRLLALKRYEQPPPRFFTEFSGQVIDRLENECGFHALPWWRRWALQWEMSPVVACSMGVVAAVLLLGGVSYFFWVEPPVAADHSVASDNIPLGTSMTPMSQGATFPAARPEFVFGSTNPLLNAQPASPFGSPTVRLTPVNYLPRNN